MAKEQNIYRAFMDSLYHLAYIKDDQRRYVAVNPSFKTFFDIKDSAIIGMSDEEIWGDEKTKDCKLSDEFVLNHRKNYETTERVHGRYFKTSKFPLLLDNGKIGIGAISEDISETIQVKNRLASYFNNAPEGIFVVDESGKYIDANPVACQMTGYEKSQLL